jgi:hypothetical protein
MRFDDDGDAPTNVSYHCMLLCYAVWQVYVAYRGGSKRGTPSAVRAATVTCCNGCNEHARSTVRWVMTGL